MGQRLQMLRDKISAKQHSHAMKRSERTSQTRPNRHIATQEPREQGFHRFLSDFERGHLVGGGAAASTARPWGDCAHAINAIN